MTTREQTFGRYLRWLLAALSLGAGVIHFAYSGDHYELSWMHGTFFAVVVWLQLSWAVAVVLRPTRRMLIAGVALNAGIVAVWVVSRVWGVPIGPGAWTPEAVGWGDGLASGFEAVIVGVSLAVLVRPAIARARIRPALAMPAVAIPVLAVAVISSLALSPALASSHTHAGVAGHDHSALAADAGSAHAGHDHGLFGVTNAAVGTTPCEQAGPPVSSGQVADAEGGHGHRGPVGWVALTDPAQRTLLEQQLGQAHEVTLQYPTVAAATAGGYRLVAGYVPCIGAHYINYRYMTGFDPAHPGMLLYDGTTPDAQIVGVSYAMLGKTAAPPEGFVGPNDPWHQHNLNGGLCMKGGVVIGAESTSNDDCKARGGTKLALNNLWMNHAWVADGWPSSWGMFSAENPDLGGVVGNSHATPEEVRAAVKKIVANKKAN